MIVPTLCVTAIKLYASEPFSEKVECALSLKVIGIYTSPLARLRERVRERAIRAKTTFILHHPLPQPLSRKRARGEKFFVIFVSFVVK